MDLTFAVYNAEWMKDLFDTDGTPRRHDQGSDTIRAHGERSRKLAEVVRALDADVLCIVEGPDTLADGSKTASQQLLAWRDLHGLDPDYDAVHGITSPGQQELCALFRASKVSLVHDPETRAKKHPFTEAFLVDTDDSLIKESYKHYRPPLELSMRDPLSGDELARIIVAHTKSKGIFDKVDMARFEQLSLRNRKKLFAECYSIRERCDQWMSDDSSAKVIVCGDINDGFGTDYYELRYSRSAVETLLGDVWSPDLILRQVVDRPKLGRYGWSPSSSRYRDRLTGDWFNVLIDHVLVSRSLPFQDGLVWNPYLSGAPAKVSAVSDELKKAADHFPVSLTVSV